MPRPGENSMHRKVITVVVVVVVVVIALAVIYAPNVGGLVQMHKTPQH